MTRLCVLGGAGYLGRHLIRRCPEGAYAILSVDRVTIPENDTAAGDFERRVADLTDGDAVAACCRDQDIVWIRAAVLGGDNSVKIEQAGGYFANNVEILMNVLLACEDHEPTRLIFDSSEQVFGVDGGAGLPSPETEPRPMNYYGASKVTAEKALRLWAAKSSGRSAQVFRYSRVRNGRSKDVIYHMAKASLLGEPITIFGDPDRKISFVHLDDAMAANLAALERSPAFATYHVSSGRPVSLIELASRVRRVSGRDGEIKVVPFSSYSPFEPSVVGMEWEESAETLGVWPRWTIDDMIRETLDNDPVSF